MYEAETTGKPLPTVPTHGNTLPRHKILLSGNHFGLNFEGFMLKTLGILIQVNLSFGVDYTPSHTRKLLSTVFIHESTSSDEQFSFREL